MDTLNNIAFIRYVFEKIEHNQNFLCAVIGQTGSGKSYFALRFAEKIDPGFNIERICFTGAQFLRLIQLPEDKLPSGSVITFDEGGTGMGSRDWQSVSNKLLSAVLQTFRFRNLIVFFTVPDISFMDSHARKLFHCTIETKRIDNDRRIQFVKPLLVRTNPATGEVFNTFLRYHINGQLVVCHELAMKKASRELLRMYELRKSEFAKTLYKNAQAEMGGEELKNAEKVLAIPESYKQIYERLVAGDTKRAIMKEQGLTYHTLDKMLKQLDRLGYDYKKARSAYRIKAAEEAIQSLGLQ